ncbi:SURF1 family protein [Oceanibium sediminis]|uniref:SURF1 family protein n=1 Tax=Oceanibium sediminis TaxID=2026339 RepID=UPI000DD4CD54|nr:SURF1 family protein [Oceanibium sediminis]
MKKFIVPVIFGFGGFAVLVALALWQVQRLEWKTAVLDQISARLEAAPVPLPEQPDPEADRYLSVTADGAFSGPALHVLTSVQFEGPGFRVIQALDTGTRRVLVDRGYVSEELKATEFAKGPLTVTGTLLWPQETDSFTPEPNLERNIWFARDVEAMAQALGTEPVLLVARAPTGDPSPRPLPVGVNIANNHLQYAITWSLLAICWLAMSVYLLYRIRRNSV